MDGLSYEIVHRLHVCVHNRGDLVVGHIFIEPEVDCFLLAFAQRSNRRL